MTEAARHFDRQRRTLVEWTSHWISYHFIRTVQLLLSISSIIHTMVSSRRNLCWCIKNLLIRISIWLQRICPQLKVYILRVTAGNERYTLISVHPCLNLKTTQRWRFQRQSRRRPSFSTPKSDGTVSSCVTIQLTPWTTVLYKNLTVTQSNSPPNGPEIHYFVHMSPPLDPLLS